MSNGTFTLDADGDQWPDGWPHPEGATWEKDGNVRFLRLRSSKPGQMVMLYRRIDLPKPAPAALEVRLRLRHTDVKAGEKQWYDARVMANFKDQAGRVLKPGPQTPNFRGSSKEWLDRVYLAQVPVGAAYFEIMPALFQPAAGTLDVARCEVFAATAEQWAATQPKIVPSEPLAAAKQKSWPPELRVAGNQLKTADGRTVWLQGLCVDSLQWSAAGEHLQQSIPVAIEQWKANVIRLPVTEQFWFGRGKGQKADEGGLAYRKTVDAAIEAAASRGAYVALDLHRFGAPKPEHADFWKDAATRYKNHPAVLFELFNEPHSISWKLWRDGGNLTAPGSKRKDTNPAENADELTGETSPGMQGLLTPCAAPARRTSSSPAAWTGATTSPASSASTPCRSGPAATASCIRRTSIPGRAIGSGTPWTRLRSSPSSSARSAARRRTRDSSSSRRPDGIRSKAGRKTCWPRSRSTS